MTMQAFDYNGLKELLNAINESTINNNETEEVKMEEVKLNAYVVIVKGQEKRISGAASMVVDVLGVHFLGRDKSIYATYKDYDYAFLHIEDVEVQTEKCDQCKGVKITN